MADTSKKFSELTSASQVNETDIVAMSQEGSGGTWASVKATILALATKIATGINFTSALQTMDKTITGAINEINSISYGTIASITAGNNETLAEAIDRLRDNYFDDKTPYKQIKMDIDGTTNMIFRCVRWTNTNVSLWEATKPTSDASMTTIIIGMSSTVVSVRKFVTSSSGVAGTNISDNAASGTIIIQGAIGANL